jgi:flagellar protein FlgJ
MNVARINGPGSPPPAAQDERARLKEVSEQFEAIMIRRLLEQARSSRLVDGTPLTGGGLGEFEAMRDEHFADLAASNGGFGFARALEAQLAHHHAASKDC